MQHAVLRLRGVRMAAVLVERSQLHNQVLLARLQNRLELPVMLVVQDGTSWTGAKAKAQFDAEPYLYELLSNDDIDWSELPAEIENELPF